MAASAEEIRRVELGLNAVEAVLRDLPTVVDTWGSMGDDERIVWSLEWGNEMSRLRRIVSDDAAGLLSPEQANRCRGLVKYIQAAQASIHVLGLHDPFSGVDTSPRHHLSRAAG